MHKAAAANEALFQIEGVVIPCQQPRSKLEGLESHQTTRR
jgi:hypothetical protein